MLKNKVEIGAFTPKVVDATRLAELCAAPPDGQAYVCRTTLAGSANLHYLPAHAPRLDACKPVNDYLSRPLSHGWRDDVVILFNRPCYVVTANGAVVTEDGQVVADSVYPSAGEETPARFLDVQSASDDLRDVLAAAGRLNTDKVAVSFFSRWSKVYFHALAEVLVQFDVLRRLGLLPDLQHIAPATLSGVQRKFAEFAGVALQAVDTPVVRVGRTLFSSVARRHAVLGLDFRQMVEGAKLRVEGDAAGVAGVKTAPKLYISRKGETMRPMLNEAEVTEVFRAAGFTVVQPQGLSLAEQVKLFSGASVVAGPHGAGLANAAWAKAGATLFEMRGLNRKGGSPDMNESYRKLSAIMGMRYGFHIAENEPDTDGWTLPVSAAEQIARGL